MKREKKTQPDERTGANRPTIDVINSTHSTLERRVVKNEVETNYEKKEKPIASAKRDLNEFCTLQLNTLLCILK